MKVLENYSLKNNNTFRVDVFAKYFAKINSKSEIKELLEDRRFMGLPIFILGDGSNVLFTQDFEGLIIKVNLKGIKIIEEKEDNILLEVGAGVNWDSLVQFAVENNWGGIENMALIPGTVGAAPVQNIAAYGQNLVDVFDSLEAIEIETGKPKLFSKEDCRFTYRNSIFKNEYKDKFIVTKVKMRLIKNPQINVSYFETGKTYKEKGSLEAELGEIAKPPYSIKDVYQAVVNIRKRKLPDPNIIGTAGSFFKNPIVKKEVYEKLKESDSDLQCYPVDKLTYPKLDDPNLTYADYVKLPAGRLLDDLGWKGKRIGNVGTFEKQALAVVNYEATGKEILEFTKKMEKVIFENYQIKLEPEVEIVGDKTN